MDIYCRGHIVGIYHVIYAAAAAVTDRLYCLSFPQMYPVIHTADISLQM